MKEQKKSDLTAIIGMSCRFPGADDYNQFWKNMEVGVNSISEIPSQRWEVEKHYSPVPNQPNKTISKWGGLVEGIDEFDAELFNISPREAGKVDPQHRIMLELSWSCIEDAGYSPSQLSGKNVGVFMGACNYDSILLMNRNQDNVEGHSGTGTWTCMIPNRISSFFNLHGPSIPIDTACSSSLVAIHYALKSLKELECEMALVGGISVLFTSTTYIQMSQLGMLSPTGQCRTFSSDADGYVRGEGAGVVLLKPLTKAIEDGDQIYGVIKGSAVNHGGKARTITSPNVYAQAQVIRAAYTKANISPNTVSYIESHGTGTPLGDPIEINALKRAYRQLYQQYGVEKTEKPYCGIGAVKSNIGHLEGAAGIAGLIKVLLAMKYKKLPQIVNFKELNPRISLKDTPFYLIEEAQEWKRLKNESGEEIPRRAGLSSFGIGGVNAHIVLEEPLEEEIKNQKRVLIGEVSSECKTHILQSKVKSDSIERPQEIFTLSAQTEKAVRELAKKYQTYLQSKTEASLQDICFSASTGRTHFAERLAIVAESNSDLEQKLADFLEDNETNRVVIRGKAQNQEKDIAFLFTGQGSQYIDMGRQLYETQPTFHKIIDQCNEILKKYLEIPLLEVIYPKDAQKSSTSLIDQTAYTQPALFAIEYALGKLWESWGIKPSVVMGHSVGEYVAACIAGVFSLEDGLKLIAIRGRLMQKLPSGGEMVSVMASESLVAEAIGEYSSRVTIAAINGPESIVISGEREAIATICSKLEVMGVKTKKLQVSHAFHSPMMEPMLAEFEAVAEEVIYNQPKIPLVSNVTGKKAGNEVTKAEYWVNHIRKPVQFHQSIKTLHEQGNQLFLEVGPKPILLGMGRQCLPEDVGVWLPSLRPGVEEWQQMLLSLGKLYVKGITVNWSEFDSDYTRQKVALPTYPFQRQRYWVEKTENKQNEHQKLEKISQTPIVKLLTQGKTEALTQQLEKALNFSPEQLKLLPEIINVLAKQHQEQLAAVTIKNWFYEVQWKPLAQKYATTSTQLSHWLIFADTTGVAEKLAQKLQQQGHKYSLVYRGESYQKLAAGKYQVNPDIPEEFEKLYQEVQESSETPLSKLIHLWSLDAPESKDLTLKTLEETQLWGCGSVIHLLQTLLKNNSTPQLWLVTRGSQSVLSKTENKMAGLAASPLWGLGRVMSLEHPQLWGGLIDLDPQALAADETEMLWQLLANQKQEDHLALRGEKTYVARLVNKDTPEFSQPLSLSSGSYLITGGLGALGLHTAQWLVEKGAKNIVLTGRRPPREKVSESIKQLEKTGCQVRVLLGDVSVEADIGKILEQIQTSMPTLKGIIHAAGITGEAQLLHDLELSQLEAVLRPKVVGGWLLHQLTQKLELDFFVNFSSIASVWGSKGQAHYAAANHFLDGLTYYRRSLGTPSYSINWGPWSGGGMATGEAMNWLNQTGVKPLESEKAIAALEKVLVSNSSQTVVADINWRLFKELYELGGKRSLLEEISLDSEATDVESAEEQDARKQKVKAEFLAKLEQASNEKRQEMLTEHIRGQVAQVLGLSSSQLPEVNVGFTEMGMDSLMTVELKNRLQNQLGTNLPETIAMEYPTITKLSLYIEELMGWKTTENGAFSDSLIQTDVSEIDGNILPVLEDISEEDFEALAAQQLEKLKNIL
ncbi:type I polyketide synthase [Okeania sp. SIO2B3]|uniref:type I polyketide synthase n=1 Tax=Okeania sp. SIO2B3 TaxID=2607784 RepID=UPI0013BEC838|nr:type I polyketide synthase [Okeania sp. SIO2B3]NET45424.1 type I polyketide synthase [Okeania sp. SIO2B3]